MNEEITGRAQPGGREASTGATAWRGDEREPELRAKPAQAAILNREARLARLDGDAELPAKLIAVLQEEAPGPRSSAPGASSRCAATERPPRPGRRWPS